jgi:hypothetical protein
MIIDNIITIIHIIFFYAIAFSPLYKNIEYKKLILIILIFLVIHFLMKYGKCGLINLENYIRGDDIHNGYLFKLIKPVICYKRNIFYKYFFIILIYIFILYYQIRESGSNMNLILEFRDIVLELYKKYKKN